MAAINKKDGMIIGSIVGALVLLTLGYLLLAYFLKWAPFEPKGLSGEDCISGCMKTLLSSTAANKCAMKGEGQDCINKILENPPDAAMNYIVPLCQKQCA